MPNNEHYESIILDVWIIYILILIGVATTPNLRLTTISEWHTNDVMTLTGTNFRVMSYST